MTTLVVGGDGDIDVLGWRVSVAEGLETVVSSATSAISLNIQWKLTMTGMLT